MRYQLAPLFVRPWTLNGITPRLIENHYELNYGDALRRKAGFDARRLFMLTRTAGVSPAS